MCRGWPNRGRCTGCGDCCITAVARVIVPIAVILIIFAIVVAAVVVIVNIGVVIIMLPRGQH